MKVPVMEGELCANFILEREPTVLNGIEVRGVRRQEFAGTACAFNELPRFLRLVAGGLVVQHALPWLADGDHPVLAIGFAASRIAGSLEPAGRAERVVVERVHEAHSLGAVPRLLSPAGFAPGAPALGQGFLIVAAGLSHLSAVLWPLLGQRRATLRPQLLSSFGVAKGLFFCG